MVTYNHTLICHRGYWGDSFDRSVAWMKTKKELESRLLKIHTIRLDLETESNDIRDKLDELSCIPQEEVEPLLDALVACMADCYDDDSDNISRAECDYENYTREELIDEVLDGFEEDSNEWDIANKLKTDLEARRILLGDTC